MSKIISYVEKFYLRLISTRNENAMDLSKSYKNNTFHIRNTDITLNKHDENVMPAHSKLII